ncbi:MAG: hypothetical protein L6V78_00635 [Clostridium sp.]|nr:MAG: hypothetical protein L6V78_00635 [Clostridium sp.]
MDNLLDIEAFLNGYKSISNYNIDALIYYYNLFLLDEYSKNKKILNLEIKILKLLKQIGSIKDL